MEITVADPGGAPEARAPPAPVKTSQKKDGRHHGPQVLQVIGPPPSDKFLDPLLNQSASLEPIDLIS